ncbi:MAG: tetratricopeptide repeat protein [Candidatus Heimdallarchaeaceae archaeon]
MILELKRYQVFLSDREKNWLRGLLNIEKYDSLSQYYQILLKNWDDIIKEDIPAIYQAIISYVLMIYFEDKKLGELYNKFKTIESASNYLMILTRQSKINTINEIIELFEKSDSSSILLISKIDLLIWLTYYFSYCREFEKAKNLLDELKKYIEEYKHLTDEKIGYFQVRALLLDTKGLYYEITTQYEKTLDVIDEAIKLLENNEIFDSFLLGTLYNSIGSVQSSYGRPTAREQYQKGYEYFRKENIERGMIVCQANIGFLYIQEGKFEEALQNMLNFLEYMEKAKDRRNVLVSYGHIYACYKSILKMDKAEEYLEKAFSLMREYEIENDDIYLDAVEFYAIVGDFEKAERNLKKYYHLMEVRQEERSTLKAKWLINKGFIELKKRNIYESERLLKEGIELAQEKLLTPLILQGIIYLIELLINSYKTEEKEEKRKYLMEELEKLCQEAVVLLKEYKSIFQLVNYRLLLSTIYMLTYKLDLAYTLLKMTRQTCIDFKLTKQLNQVEEYLQLVKDLSRSSNTEIEPEIQRRKTDFELHMRDFSSKGVTDLTYLMENDEKPELVNLMVILQSGLPCYSYNFGTLRKLTEDELLLAGLLNAIQNFSSEISLEKGVFRMLEHTDYIILLEPREKYTAVLFTTKFTYTLKVQLIDFADRIGPLIDKLGKIDYLKAQELKTLTQEMDKLTEKIFIIKE